MAKNVAICFDGTWNKPQKKKDGKKNEETNVRLLYEDMVDSAEQSIWYDAGVGTHAADRVLGGTFGWGLSKNVKQGYSRLAKVYEPGDRIFLFGFSRGAYTARSLSGLIRNCGLLNPAKLEPHGWSLKSAIKRAYAIYRKKDTGPDTGEAVEFRRRHSHDGFTAKASDPTVPEIWFIGVWDTVGALGIPGGGMRWFNGRWEFHDTDLSRFVKHAYHAVAIDEHRATFEATLWKIKDSRGQQTAEQTWFVGAHADVGGGYANKSLSDIGFEWMRERAVAAQLKLERRHNPSPAATGKIHDSYEEFVGGAYRWFTKRKYRSLGDPAPAPGKLHPTVNQRYESQGGYRPRNLRKYKEAGGK